MTAAHASAQPTPPPRKRTWKGPRALPATLPDAACYVLWRYGSQPNGKGKFPKLPFSPHKNDQGKYRGAKMDDPTTWGTFAECMAAANDWRNWFDGIGKVLLDGEVGTDLDDGIDPTQAQTLIDAARGRAYLERSVSAKGWHIIILGQIADAIKTDTIEIYPGGSGRYFALGNELDGSTRPAAAQDIVDRAIVLSGTTRDASAPRTSFRTVETVALTAELAGDVAEAQARLPELLAELPSNMTVQLADLLYRGIFPPAMKDTSPSGARSVIVAQLHRAPKRKYTDAEIYVLARDIWRRKGYEGVMAGNEKKLDSDCWRLIALYRPGAAPKPAPTKRTYTEAPDPLVYLAQLADEAAGGVVLLTRDERAEHAQIPRWTAQRTEEALQGSGLIELFTYALRGQGCKGRRGALRITPAGRQALQRPNESVIFSDFAQSEHNAQVTPSAPERATPAMEVSKNTLLCDPTHTRAQSQPRVPSGSGAPVAWFGGAIYDPCLDQTAYSRIELSDEVPVADTARPKRCRTKAQAAAAKRRRQARLAAMSVAELKERRWRLSRRAARAVTTSQADIFDELLAEMTYVLAKKAPGFDPDAYQWRNKDLQQRLMIAPADGLTVPVPDADSMIA